MNWYTVSWINEDGTLVEIRLRSSTPETALEQVSDDCSIDKERLSVREMD